MRTLLPLLLLASACGVDAMDDDRPSEMSIDVAPPPTFDVSVPDTLVAGSTVTATISGTLGEDEMVILGLGTGGVGSGPCPSVLGGGGGGGSADYGVGTGGAGGGLEGEDGSPPTNTGNTNVREGFGGTQTAGGDAFQCCGSSYPNESGSFGLGGSCWHDSAVCGAGGGGYYGGGAGSFAPGGGGSSFVGWPGSTATSTLAGVNSGDGEIILSC